MDAQDLSAALAPTRICAHLTEAEISQLALIGATARKQDGEPLAEGHALAVVLHGAADLVREVAEGEPPQVTRCGPGSILNEIEFLCGGAARETVRAVGSTLVFVLSRKTFAKLVANGSTVAGKVGLNIARSVALRLDERSSALLELLRKHEALLESMDQILTDSTVRDQLFEPLAARTFDTFKAGVLGNWEDGQS